MKVLIIDNSIFWRQRFKDILDSQGYEVRDEKDENRAVEFAEEFKPDLILLSATNIELMGTEIMERFKESQAAQEALVIFTSVPSNDTMFQTDAYNAGAVGFIVKREPSADPGLDGNQKRLIASIVNRHAKTAVYIKTIKEMTAEAERKAVTDPLTGLPNRRGFTQHVDEQWDLCANDDYISLLLIDIDKFKDFNTIHGLAFGDEVLVKVAQSIASHEEMASSDADLAARWGGEEFACIMPGTSEADAAERADKIRESVATLKLGEQSDIRVTISIGVHTVLTTDKKCIKDLFNGADEALANAKQSGRNKVIKRSVI